MLALFETWGADFGSLIVQSRLEMCTWRHCCFLWRKPFTDRVKRGLSHTKVSIGGFDEAIFHMFCLKLWACNLQVTSGSSECAAVYSNLYCNFFFVLV